MVLPNFSQPYPSRLHPFVFIFLATALLLGGSSLPALAQQEVSGGGGSGGGVPARLEAEEAPQLDQLGERVAPELKSRRASASSAAPAPKLVSPEYTTHTFREQILPNDNPNPQLNFFWTGTPDAHAGDVNGDGRDDFVERQTGVRDERTTDPEDRVSGKTALFYGGSGATATSEDQLLYRFLRPAGDLNDDGFDDAIAVDFDAGTATFYAGSSSGYQDSVTEITLPAVPSGLLVRGFDDLDGDGIDDVLLGSSAQDGFVVIYGAGSFDGATAEAYQPGTDRSSFQYNLADLDGSEGGEITRLTGQKTDTTDVRLEVFEVTSGSVTEAQDIAVSDLGGAASDHQLALPDINGNGQRELATTLGFDNPTYVFTQSSDGDVLFNQTPSTLGKDDAIPVGDLDGDGKHDFYTYEEGSDTRYVAYGPDNLSDGLTFNTEIPYSGPYVGAAGFSPRGGFGDLNNDGFDDVVLSYRHSNEGPPPFDRGRRVAYGQNDRSIVRETMSIPSRYMYDRTTGVSNVGDLNGDGTDDVAVCFFDRGKVGIYYGGPALGDEPDEMLEAGWLTYMVAGGDFNGDGTQDVASVSANPSSRNHSRFDVFLGGSGPADHTVTFDGVAPAGYENGSMFYYLANAGDINNDDDDDLVLSAPFVTNDNGDYLNQVFVYYGGSGLPTTPDATIDYADSLGTGFVGAGYRLSGAGDFNGDGIDDVAVGVRERGNENGTEGAVHVFFGEDGGPTFSDGADLQITPTGDAIYQFFSGGLRGGSDVDGDGNSDLVVMPWVHSFGDGGHAGHIYYGGDEAGRGDGVVDEYLDAPTDALGPNADGNDLDGDGLVDINQGNVSLTDIDQDGPAEVILTTGFSVNTNVLLYSGQGSPPNEANAREPDAVFEAPNSTVDLGGPYKMATGDVTGDDNVDIVAGQGRDDNDAGWSSRLYRYQPEMPAASATETVDGSGFYSFGETGTAIDISGVEGSDDVSVDRFDQAPASIPGIEEDNVSSYRVQIEAGDGLSFESADVRFDVSTLPGTENPGTVTIYTRESTGDSFTALSTDYNENTDELIATVSSFSEFVFASNDNPLPVELASFNGTATDGSARLTWQTASETNNAGFEVQRQKDERWTQVGFVDSKAQGGTTTETQSYNYTAEDLPVGTHQFRLKQVDLDGSSTLIDPVTVDIQMQEALKLTAPSPNPTSSSASLSFAVKEQAETTIRLYNTLGQQVATVYKGTPQAGEQQRAQVDVSGLSSGTYFLRLSADGQTQAQRLTVVR